MSKLIVLVVLAAAGVFAGQYLAKLALSVADPRERKLLSTLSRVLQYGTPLVCFVVLVFWTFVSVDAGHVGVVRAFGKVEPTPLY